MRGDRRRTRVQVLLGGWILLIGAMALWTRPLAAALRDRGALTTSMTVTALAVGWLCLRLLADRDGDREPLVPWTPLVLTAVALVWLGTWWKLPEERVHLLQYVPLGIIAWRALGGRALAALLLCFAVGAGDEWLQGTLPERTFDPWDLVANAIASTAAVLLSMGGRTAWLALAFVIAARLVLPVVHVGHPGADAVPPPGPAGTALEPPTAPYAGASVLLVTIDALRADHAPPWGDPGVPTPALARMAAESVTFDGFANGIWTTPSMVSLLTGLLPPVHGVQERGQELNPAWRTPLEALTGAGWSTAGHAGDDTGTYRNLGFQRELGEGARADVVAAALAGGPSFVWLHLREVHAPYDASPERLHALGLPSDLPEAPLLHRARTHYTVPRAEFSGDHDGLRDALRALYAAEVADADATLGRVLARLDADGLMDRTIVVLTADHGEELLEGGGVGHASTTLASEPRPELVEIPLYVRLPDGRGAGRRVAGRFEQVDLMPTLLPLLGLELPDPAPSVGVDGRDLGPAVLDGAPVTPRDSFVSSSPCGWQCPPERRSERVHAVVGADGSWGRCAEPGSCDPRVSAPLLELRSAGEAAPPVPSPG